LANGNAISLNKGGDAALVWPVRGGDERLYQEAPSGELEKQIRTLNAFSQMAMAYLKSIGAASYSHRPDVDA
jgi:hypothetical protein